MLEETGWTLTGIKGLGFLHFHHLGEKPQGYEYPYPDFVWPVFTAEAVDFDAGAIQPDDWVKEPLFVPAEEVPKLPIAQGQLLLLEAALKLSG